MSKESKTKSVKTDFVTLPPSSVEEFEKEHNVNVSYAEKTLSHNKEYYFDSSNSRFGMSNLKAADHLKKCLTNNKYNNMSSIDKFDLAVRLYKESGEVSLLITDLIVLSDFVEIYKEGINLQQFLKNEEPLPIKELVALASASNRDKQPEGVIGEVEGSSTWNHDQLGESIVSWIGECHVPTAYCSVSHYKDRLLSIWDGHSKLDFACRFLRGEKIFKVLKSNGDYLPYVQDLLKNPVKYTGAIDEEGQVVNLDIIKMLCQAIKKYQNYNKAQPKTNRSDFLTSTWLEQNGFEGIVKKLLNSRWYLDLANMNLDQELAKYGRIAMNMADQTDAQLARSAGKTAYDEFREINGKMNTKFRFEYCCFQEEDSPFFPDIHADMYCAESKKKKGYQGYDSYVYDFLLSLCFQLSQDKDGNFSISSPYRNDREYLRALVRAKDFDGGAGLTRAQATKFYNFKTDDSIPDSVKDSARKYIKKIINATEFLMGLYNKNIGYTGLSNDSVTENMKSFLHKTKTTVPSEEQYQCIEMLKSFGFDPARKENKKKARAFHKRTSFEMMKYACLSSAIIFYLQNKELNIATLNKIVKIFLDTHIEEWLEYCWNTKMNFTKQAGSKNKLPDFEIRQNDWISLIDKKKGVSKDKPIYGPCLALIGYTDERTAEVYTNFVQDRIIPKLLEDNNLSSASTTKLERSDFMKYWLEEYKDTDTIFNIKEGAGRLLKGTAEWPEDVDTKQPYGVSIKDHDIGHLNPEKLGNNILDKLWILELIELNRKEHKYNNKDQQKWFLEMNARANEHLEQETIVINQSKAVIDDDNILASLNNQLTESEKLVQRTKYALEYFGYEWNDSLLINDVEELAESVYIYLVD